MTLVVNMFGGPGSGKSTTAAGLFSELKERGYNCEMVREYAKDIVWAETTKTLQDQIYIFAKQLHKMRVLVGKVDLIITDSPILLSLIYGKDKEPASFFDLVTDIHDTFNNMNIYVKRTKEFNPAGRLQNEDQARALDDQIKDMIFHIGESITQFTVGGYASVPSLADIVEQKLKSSPRDG